MCWVCVCAELHQTQLIIQRELATLQAAVSQSNLPVEERPGQEATMGNQEAVLANTESLLHAMEVKNQSLSPSLPVSLTTVRDNIQYCLFAVSHCCVLPPP